VAGAFRDNPNVQIWTSSVGTMGGVESQIKRFSFLSDKKHQIHIHKSDFDFNDLMKWCEVPFPCNQHWDKKAWYWLTQNIENLKGNVLFWNLGGNNEFVPPFRTMKGANYFYKDLDKYPKKK
jgi:hypothetical protein